MIHLPRLPTPSDQDTHEEKTLSSIDIPHKASREELARSFLSQRQEETSRILQTFDGEKLFDVLAVKDKDFINNIQILDDSHLEQLMLACSKIVKSHKNFDHALADKYLKAERTDFKIDMGVRAGLLVAIGGGIALVAPLAALSFATVFIALGHKDLSQRNKHTDEFALTRLALLEQESVKRKLQAGRGLDPNKNTFDTHHDLGQPVDDEISIRRSSKPI